ncbi:MAG: glycerophosphodiester phosphodiesterase family protein [Wenzhouxiangella sp.]|nr:glycerophosphodiester phosphodiesterase family protein [Wenzhouxiangella sp.]
MNETSAATWSTRSGGAPLVIAHRGASGERPEHTEGAYLLALEQGADVLEPDLQMSADGRLIVRHDPYLSTSTDVADRPEFAERRVERNGRSDWWVMDFTAAELRSLKARQVLADRSQKFNDQYPVLTFTDFLDFVAEQERRCGCAIPIEPEVKLPALYTQAGLDPLPALLSALEVRGLDPAGSAVMIQSFDPSFLKRLRPETPLPLLMLYAGPDEPGANADGLSLEAIARFADGIGASKAVLVNSDGSSTGFLEQTHALGLDVHTWTIRDDRPPITGQTVEDELRALYALGVDAVFADFPATAVSVRQAMHP